MVPDLPNLILYVFAGGAGVTLLMWVAFRLSPPGGPPEYILNMEAEQLLMGKELVAADDAVEQLVKTVPEVAPTKSTRMVINDDVLTQYNAYKAQCMANRKKPLGLSRWVYNFDPDLYRRVFTDE